ncbi:hypothetical protein PMAYCL1PPCAC_31073, partial [Pristionchus mayeri]
HWMRNIRRRGSSSSSQRRSTGPLHQLGMSAGRMIHANRRRREGPRFDDTRRGCEHEGLLELLPVSLGSQVCG